MNAKCHGEKVEYKLTGKQKRIMLDPTDVLKQIQEKNRNRNIKVRDLNSELIEVDAFSGEIAFQFDHKKGRIPLEIDAYATASGREIKKNGFINVVYLSPTDHVKG